ncbi:MAG: hypothetical protein ACREDA_04360 [Methylocella sp.]
MSLLNGTGLGHLDKYREGGYHTLEHTAGLLEQLSGFSDLAPSTEIVAVSAFWHDVA